MRCEIIDIDVLGLEDLTSPGFPGLLFHATIPMADAANLSSGVASGSGVL